MESIRLGGPAHGIMTKTVHKTLLGVVGSGGGWLGRGWWGSKGWVGRGGGVQGWLGRGGGGPGGV